jgi:hypothetical protein
MYLYRTSSIESNSKKNSHLPSPKCTYTNPAVFIPKTKTYSHLSSPKCTYKEPAVFNPNLKRIPTCPIQNIPIENQQYSIQKLNEFPPVLTQM